jgi:hypothetical protein
MKNPLWVILLAAGLAQSQSAVSAPSNDAHPTKAADANDDISPPRKLDGKVGLVRGVLKRLDPIHDQLVIRAFGGGDIRMQFDGQTQLLSDNASMHLTSIPLGTVVSVDTLVDSGKLFARSVRTGSAGAVELSGQVVRYDPTRSQLILRDPASPDSVTVRINENTRLFNKGQTVSPQALSDGMLVQVWLSPTDRTASHIEILAERGSSFTFAGRIVAVDLHARVLSLLNDTDQSLRELAFASLDNGNLPMLKEGADVAIDAEFDGDKYNIHKVTVLSHNP